MTENIAPPSIPSAQTQNPVVLIQAAILKLIRQIHNSANWFYWIAGLSVINTLLMLFDTNRSFIVGLGSTQVVDGVTSGLLTHLGSESATLLRVISFMIDLVIIGIFVFFGINARKARSWAFFIGMVLYALDALIFLLVTDWLSIAFHLFVLWQLYNGLQALNKLKKLNSMAASLNAASAA